MSPVTALRLVALAAALPAAGCRKAPDPVEGTAPPPSASATPGACAGGGGSIDDPESGAFLPRTSGDFCVDPHGSTRTYGRAAKAPLGGACTQLFDGDCEIYKRFGLVRVVTVDYVDGRGSPARISLNLSQFASREGALAFHGKRVVGDEDPAALTSKAVDAPGVAVVGAGAAYLWVGEYVAELAYANEDESAEQMTASSHRILPGVVRDLAAKLPGDRALPAAARALPTTGRVPLGLRWIFDDLLGVGGVGSGAIGHYAEGELRWRSMALTRADEAGARDVLATFRKLPGARDVKGKPFEAVAFTLRDEGSPAVDWIVARKGALVLGVGDEEHVLTGPEAELARRKPTPERKLTLLEGWTP